METKSGEGTLDVGWDEVGAALEGGRIVELGNERIAIELPADAWRVARFRGWRAASTRNRTAQPLGTITAVLPDDDGQGLRVTIQPAGERERSALERLLAWIARR